MGTRQAGIGIQSGVLAWGGSCRRQWLCLLLAVTASLTVTTVTHPPVAHADSCAEVIVVGARGSGEDKSAAKLGPTIGPAYEALKAITVASGKTIQAVGIGYDAVPVDNVDGVLKAGHFGGAYDDSVDQGVAMTRREVEQLAADCRGSKIVLAGYSQGAEVIGGAIAELSGAAKARVAATMLFGDPLFNAEDVTADRGGFDASHHGALGVRRTWGTQIGSPVFSYCHRADPICNLSKKLVTVLGATLFVRDLPFIVGASGKDVLKRHLDYVTSRDTARAANDVARVLGLKAAASPLPHDMVFVIDSTGSMGNVIDQVEDNVTRLVDTLDAASASIRFALVDYKDEPAEDSDYQARLRSPFTTDTTAFKSAVRGIEASGGGDYAESMYAGVMTALDLSWRPSAKRSVIVISDAPGKDPEPISGFTRAQVLARASAVRVGLTDVAVRRARSAESSETGDADIYGVVVGGEPSATEFLESMAEESGGSVAESSYGDDFVDRLEELIEDSSTSPIADVTVPAEAVVGTPVTFNAAGSDSAGQAVDGYDWNVQADEGEWPTTTVVPRLSTVFAEPGTYTVRMRIRLENGRSAVASAPVNVTGRPTSPPAVAPEPVTATSDPRRINLTWTNVVGAEYYLVKDDGNNVLGSITPDAGRTSTWSDLELTPGSLHRYRVVGVNSAGAGPESALVTARAGGTAVSTPPLAGTPPAETPSAITATAKPSITGVPRVGKVLVAGTGSWSMPDLVYSYQWLRDGVPIKGATSPKHVVVGRDAGSRVRAQVTARAPGLAPGSARTATKEIRRLRPALTVRRVRRAAPSGPAVLTVLVRDRAGLLPIGRVRVILGGRVIGAAALTDGTARVRLPQIGAAGQRPVIIAYSGDRRHSAVTVRKVLRVPRVAP